MNTFALSVNPFRTIGRLLARFAIVLDMATLPLGLALSCVRLSGRTATFRSTGLVVFAASVVVLAAFAMLLSLSGGRRVPRSCRFSLILSVLAFALCWFGGAP